MVDVFIEKDYENINDDVDSDDVEKRVRDKDTFLED